MKVKVAADTSTVTYRMASSHCVIMRRGSETIGRCSSVVLCQVTVRQDPKFQACQSKLEFVT